MWLWKRSSIVIKPFLTKRIHHSTGYILYWWLHINLFVWWLIWQFYSTILLSRQWENKKWAEKTRPEHKISLHMRIRAEITRIQDNEILLHWYLVISLSHTFCLVMSHLCSHYLTSKSCLYFCHYSWLIYMHFLMRLSIWHSMEQVSRWRLLLGSYQTTHNCAKMRTWGSVSGIKHLCKCGVNSAVRERDANTKWCALLIGVYKTPENCLNST